MTGSKQPTSAAAATHFSGSSNGLVGRAGLDEGVVYELVKAHIENIDNTKAKAPFARLANFDVLVDAVTGVCTTGIMYHPGAVRAWEEAGYTVPACAKL
mgnify:CR=1 FL=1